MCSASSPWFVLFLENALPFRRLEDNPYCQNADASSSFCKSRGDLGSSYTNPISCILPRCSSEQIPSPTCRCAYPFTGTLVFRAPPAFGNTHFFTNLQQDLLQKLGKFGLPVESISLSDVSVDQFGYLNMRLAVFPAVQDHFNRTGVFSLAFVFSNQTYKPPKEYGPYVFYASTYTQFGGLSHFCRIINISKKLLGIIQYFVYFPTTSTFN